MFVEPINYNFVPGTSGEDIQSGHADHDAIVSSLGDDFASGGRRSDWFETNNGDGTDIFRGGKGADTFFFNFTPDTVFSGEVDRILDFTPGKDHIDVQEGVDLDSSAYVYDANSGLVSVDLDGAGGDPAIIFLRIQKHLVLQDSDLS